MVVPLLAYAIRRASRAAIAMEARGLGANSRTIVGAPDFSFRDFVFIALAIAVLALAIAAVRLNYPQTIKSGIADVSDHAR